MAYARKSETCSHCGEGAHSREIAPTNWASGERIHPLKNSDGITCPDCRWTQFEDFCHSQGCSAHNPVVYIP